MCKGVRFPLISPLGIEIPDYWEPCGVVIPVIIWIRKGISKYSPPTLICHGLNTPGVVFLLSYVPELKYLQELVLSLYSPSKAHPKQLLSCQLVSSDVGMREHPKSRKTSPSVSDGLRNRERRANTWILKSELHWPWQEGAVGQYPWGCLVAPFVLLRSFNSAALTTTCAQKAAERLLWLVAMSTVLSLPAESQVLVGMATLLRAPKDAQRGTGCLEMALGCQWRWKLLCQRVWGAGKTRAITHLFGKLFCRIKWVLGGSIIPVYNTILSCFGRRGKQEW